MESKKPDKKGYIERGLILIAGPQVLGLNAWKQCVSKELPLESALIPTFIFLGSLSTPLHIEKLRKTSQLLRQADIQNATLSFKPPFLVENIFSNLPALVLSSNSSVPTPWEDIPILNPLLVFALAPQNGQDLKEINKKLLGEIVEAPFPLHIHQGALCNALLNKTDSGEGDSFLLKSGRSVWLPALKKTKRIKFD